MDVARTWMGETPATDSADMIVTLGGPMSTRDARKHPWLIHEKAFLLRMIADGARALGICLGAQLLAEVLGGEVTQATHREIGWHRITVSPGADGTRAFRDLAGDLPAFHWHGETFMLPAGATRLASSAACENQGFEWNDGQVVGLQFHWEYAPECVRTMITECAEDLGSGQYCQEPGEMLERTSEFERSRTLMFGLLDRLAV